MERYVVKCGNKFVSEIADDGLLIVTSHLKGSKLHPNHTPGSPHWNPTGRCCLPMLFCTRKAAEDYVVEYESMKLPRGKKHSVLTVTKVR